ncbi:uncharacterized protein EI90DRAFT_3037168 [Cantharellus anzutake]|uniref:uncharacterized protein n=1 Tax=Cantharellus anzutake TaxID=1750568 RepID=UPI0019078304|nr:uncharacterized protein EI90DRAFT_3037168 [Cantharellus anzutake]KAF8339588.1 hypothetical protein EI90DRAFT_3037168 [Cantharellus anzutake]
MESASDWNSILLTARAQRGPQWDVMTQQFLVDRGSPLYYDATALRPGSEEKERPKDEGESQLAEDPSSTHPQEPAPQSIQFETGNAPHPQQQQPPPQQIIFAPNSYMPPQAAVNGFGADGYLPPDVMRNPRRTTRGMNGREGMYRV